MKLRWKSFERSVRRRICAEVRACETLRAESKHVRKLRRQHLHLPAWASRLFIYAFAVMFLTSAKSSLQILVACIGLWTLAVSFLRASQLSGALYSSASLNVLTPLPIADEDIFKVQWKQFIRMSLWSALDFSIAYSVMAAKIGAGYYAVSTGTALGFVQWAFILATATSLFAFGPGKYFGLL